MRVSKSQTAFLMVGAVIASRLVACSPSAGSTDSQGNPQGNAGGSSTGGGNGTGASGYTGSAGDNGGPFNFGGAAQGAAQGAGGGANADCPPLVQKPEQIITYRDASVTDTITTYNPVALFIMQDRSGSMISGFPAGSPNSWPNSIAALQAFTTDPVSAGLDVGLGYFPPTSNSPDSSCMGCATPVVPIQGIRQAGPAIISSMNANAPNPLNFTPLQCGLQGMIDACKAYMPRAAGEKCVAVFVSDGNTTDPAYAGCDTNTTNLLKIVSDGKAAGVETFAIGMIPTALTFLNQVAQAGGTNAAIDASSGTAAFIAALNKIRGSVSTQSVTHISVPTTISTPLPCAWKIPVPANNGVFDKGKVNVKYTPPTGGTGEDFGYTTLADCARTGNSWYFDDPASPNPARVLLCPSTCDKVEAQPGASVEISFNCPQKPAIAK